VGTLLDEKLDPRDITATIIDLAVKGYLRIEEVKKEGILIDSKDYYLKKLKEPDSNLGKFEAEVMNGLVPKFLPEILVSSLKKKFYTNLDILKNFLYKELERKKYIGRNPEKVRKLYILIGSTLTFLALEVFTSKAGFSWRILGAFAMAGLPILILGRFMPAKTRAGALAKMEILGFQEFLNRAEKTGWRGWRIKTCFQSSCPMPSPLASPTVGQRLSKIFIRIRRSVWDACRLQNLQPLQFLSFLQTHGHKPLLSPVLRTEGKRFRRRSRRWWVLRRRVWGRRRRKLVAYSRPGITTPR